MQISKKNQLMTDRVNNLAIKILERKESIVNAPQIIKVDGKKYCVSIINGNTASVNKVYTGFSNVSHWMKNFFTNTAIRAKNFEIEINKNLTQLITQQESSKNTLPIDSVSRLGHEKDYGYQIYSDISSIREKHKFQIDSVSRLGHKIDDSDDIYCDIGIIQEKNIADNMEYESTMKLWNKLKKDGSEKEDLISEGITRYSDVRIYTNNQLHPDLPANKIIINGQHIANAAQYPTQENMDTYLGVLANTNPSCLVVLASDNDMEEKKKDKNNQITNEPLFPDYFRPGNDYGTSLKETYETGHADYFAYFKEEYQTFNLSVSVNQMAIENSEKEVVVPMVYHVKNWLDKKSMTTEELIILAEGINYEKEIFNEEKPGGAPMIHCKAGVGRTGTLIAAMALLTLDNNDTLSLEGVVTQMRESRSPFMVQKPEQLDTLVDLCKLKGINIFKPENPSYNDDEEHTDENSEATHNSLISRARNDTYKLDF
ncbi:protein-tyrosine phosphatase family protein [Yersinia bercovieri]|uniref:protein-tyrosine phosphatase family protein n=1 Tax=Yersinia bercovieri TaxID=634 RepID=UPI0011AB7448|nr:protein-tyrosine phosphatase family protein [Yersinia bercovieri]